MVLHERNIPSIQATQKGQEGEWRDHWGERRKSFDILCSPQAGGMRLLTIRFFFVSFEFLVSLPWYLIDS